MKGFTRFTLLLLALVFMLSGAFSYTTKTGTISSSETWGVPYTDSTIYVSGNVYISGVGNTLTILPGTVVKIRPTYEVRITNGANIDAEGESGNEIYFTSCKDQTVGEDLSIPLSSYCSGAPNRYDVDFALVLANTAGTSSNTNFSYINFRWADYGIYNNGALFGSVHDCNFSRINIYGLYNYGTMGDVIDNNFGNSISGIRAYYATTGNIANNTFVNNSSYGIYQDHGSIQSVTNNVFGNTGYGFYNYYGSIFEGVTNNQFINNSYGLYSYYAPISGGVTNNIFFGNTSYAFRNYGSSASILGGVKNNLFVQNNYAFYNSSGSVDEVNYNGYFGNSIDVSGVSKGANAVDLGADPFSSANPDKPYLLNSFDPGGLQLVDRGGALSSAIDSLNQKTTDAATECLDNAFVDIGFHYETTNPSQCAVVVTCPDGVCSSGESCRTDDSACSLDNMCYEPACVNGCDEAEVVYTEIDEACHETSGCAEPPCWCNGSGSCVEADYMEVSGTISANTTWDRGTIYVSANVTVSGTGTVLTIAPGTVVKYAQNTSIIIQSGASVSANGLEGQEIYFTPCSDATVGYDLSQKYPSCAGGSWSSSYFDYALEINSIGTTSATDFSYLIFRGSTYGIYLQGTSVIGAIHHNRFSMNEYGIVNDGASSTTYTQVHGAVYNNIFSNNTGGIYNNDYAKFNQAIHDNNFSENTYGIYNNDRGVFGQDIYNNNFFNNTNYGIYNYYYSTFNGAVYDNNFSGNGNYAIYNYYYTYFNGNVYNNVFADTSGTAVTNSTYGRFSYFYDNNFIDNVSDLFPSDQTYIKAYNNLVRKGNSTYYIDAGNIDYDLTLANAESDTHLFFMNSEIRDSGKLTIPPGTVVKYSGGELIIDSSTTTPQPLVLQGTPDATIYLTSCKDQTVGANTSGVVGCSGAPSSNDLTYCVHIETGASTNSATDFSYFSCRYARNGIYVTGPVTIGDIHHCEFDNIGVDNTEYYAVRNHSGTMGSVGGGIYDCNFTNLANMTYGFYNYNGPFTGDVNNNVFSGGQYGLVVYSDNLYGKVHNNLFEDFEICLDLRSLGVVSGAITNNTFSNCSSKAINFMYSNSSANGILNNIFSENGTGIYVASDASTGTINYNGYFGNGSDYSGGSGYGANAVLLAANPFVGSGDKPFLLDLSLPGGYEFVDAGSGSAVSLGLAEKTALELDCLDVGIVELGYHYPTSSAALCSFDPTVDTGGLYFDYSETNIFLNGTCTGVPPGTISSCTWSSDRPAECTIAQNPSGIRTTTATNIGVINCSSAPGTNITLTLSTTDNQGNSASANTNLSLSGPLPPAPIAAAGGPYLTALPSTAISLDGTASTDSDDCPSGGVCPALDYAWEIIGENDAGCDPTTATGAIQTINCSQEGSSAIRLTVTDSTARSDTDTAVIIVTGEGSSINPSGEVVVLSLSSLLLSPGSNFDTAEASVDGTGNAHIAVQIFHAVSGEKVGTDYNSADLPLPDASIAFLSQLGEETLDPGNYKVIAGVYRADHTPLGTDSVFFTVLEHGAVAPTIVPETNALLLLPLLIVVLFVLRRS